MLFLNFIHLIFRTELISAQLKLLRLNSGRESRVISAMTLLKRKLFQFGIFFIAIIFIYSMNAL
jgi:hypothetical protein